MLSDKPSLPTRHKNVVIGIHSGMGPLAGYAFSERFHELLRARYTGHPGGDKAHPVILTYSDSQTPKRDKNIDDDKAIVEHLLKGAALF